MEQKTGLTLVTTSSSGISFTDEGKELLSFCEQLFTLSEKTQAKLYTSNQKDAPKTLSIATTVSLQYSLVAPVADLFYQKFGLRLRLLSLDPGKLIEAALKEAFDIAVYLGQKEWPKAWDTANIGELSWVVAAKPDHPALSSAKTNEDLLPYPFITPSYLVSGELESGDDFFPIPMHRRLRGHEVSTALEAIKLVAASDQLAHVPYVVAKDAQQRGLIQIWRPEKANDQPVSQPLGLAALGTQVKSSHFRWLQDQFAGAIDAANTH
jgi:DNA-binding transcriptional LysR family regulator